MTTYKFKSMRGVNSKIAELQATTSNLTLDEKKSLLASLERDVQAAADKTNGPKQRLASVKAAALSKDERVSESFKIAVRGLQRLGLEIDTICASGDISTINAAMRALKWTVVQRIMLKNALNIIGALS